MWGQRLNSSSHKRTKAGKNGGKEKRFLGEKGDLEIIHKWYLHKLEYVQENEMHKIQWDFETQKRSPNLCQKTRLIVNKQENDLSWSRFYIPLDYSVKIQEREKLDKYLDSFSKQTKQWWRWYQYWLVSCSGFLEYWKIDWGNSRIETFRL